MFRKIIAVGPHNEFPNPHVRTCTESYYVFGLLIYRRDKLISVA